MNIQLSAGHYPGRPGAVWQGFSEHEEAVLWVSELHEALCNSGFGVVGLVRTGLLKEKVAQINQSDTDLAVEIHFNSDERRAGKGCETLIYPGSTNGRKFGEVVQSAMADVMGNDRGVKDGYHRLNPKNRVNYFLRKTKCTALIIEPEFLHNIEMIRAKRRKCCEAIADALASLC